MRSAQYTLTALVAGSVAGGVVLLATRLWSALALQLPF